MKLRAIRKATGARMRYVVALRRLDRRLSLLPITMYARAVARQFELFAFFMKSAKVSLDELKEVVDAR